MASYLRSKTNIISHIKLNEKDLNYAIVSLSITENKSNGTNIISTLNYIKVKSRQPAYFSIINSDTDTIDCKLNLAIENPFIRLEKPRGTVNQIKSSILISNILSSSDMKHVDVH
jgi:hypothetical protein